MKTQGTANPEIIVPHASGHSTIGRSPADTNESEAPEFKAKLSHMVDRSKARATEWKDGLQDGIREKPIQSVLIAAAVGAAIGLIVGRRSR